MDGGKTWDLLDSRDNSLPFSTRDHFFAAGNGTSVFKIVADPRLTPTGEAIFYAALSDLSANGTGTYNQLVTGSGQPIRGGLWRSVDSGRTWTQMRAGQAWGQHREAERSDQQAEAARGAVHGASMGPAKGAGALNCVTTPRPGRPIA